MLRLASGVRFGWNILLAASCTAACVAQTKAPPPTAPVVMLSDIHFDPFRDPAKVKRLREADLAQWEGIFAEPDTPTQAADFAALQKTCGAGGIDTPWALLRSSIDAEGQTEPQPLFVTVSGDLMAHEFVCKFHTLAPDSGKTAYSAFAARTVAFVAQELQRAFPKSPVYLALGNNDSGCKDYAEDMGSSFLKDDAISFGPHSLNAPNSLKITHEFPQLGDYNIELPAPMHHTRLIVLQDIFESKKFTTCDGTVDKTAAAKQLAWLRAQLTAAAAKQEHVWVMAHIPPGIDVYANLTKHTNVCGGGDPALFLSSTALGDLLIEFGETVRLGLFGHTHMDEIKLLHNGGRRVAIKQVPSITPVNGNNPAFTIAKVDPSTATLVDYTVYAANNQTGKDTVWSKEYTYSAAYKLPDYSPDSLEKLTAAFLADRSGSGEASRAYQSYYFVGDPGVSASLKAAAMQLIWPAYACSTTEGNATAYRACACKAPASH